MATIHYLILAVTAVWLVGGVTSVTDREFQDLSATVRDQGSIIKQLMADNKELSAVVQDQGSTINQLVADNKELRAIVNVRTSNARQETLTLDCDNDEENHAQNNTLEERVALLEIQVVEIEEDVTGLDDDVNFLFDEQVIQDERLFQLEMETGDLFQEVDDLQVTTLELDFRVTELEEDGGSDGNSSISELEVRVETLEGTAADHEARIISNEGAVEDLQVTTLGLDFQLNLLEETVNSSISELEERVETLEGTTVDHEARLTSVEENIQGLQSTDAALDERITALEENGGSGGGNATIGFQAVLTYSPTINIDETVVFDLTLLNEGNGYDTSTGVFTVPSSGLYYFSIFMMIQPGERAGFEIVANGVIQASAFGEHDESGDDATHVSCSAVVNVAEGDEVEVVYIVGTDTTPIYGGTPHLYTGFNGFKI